MIRDFSLAKDGTVVVYNFDVKEKYDIAKSQDHLGIWSSVTYWFTPIKYFRYYVMIYMDHHDSYYKKIEFMANRGQYGHDWIASKFNILKDRRGKEVLDMFALSDELFVEYSLNFNDEYLDFIKECEWAPDILLRSQ